MIGMGPFPRRDAPARCHSQLRLETTRATGAGPAHDCGHAPLSSGR
jgi:hypothetical protein